MPIVGHLFKNIFSNIKEKRRIFTLARKKHPYKTSSPELIVKLLCRRQSYRKFVITANRTENF